VALEWIVEMDAGKPIDVAVAERQRLFPEHADLIGWWREGWPEMLRGEIAGTVEILADLKMRGRQLYALTNFSKETFPLARARCASLELFDHVVVSGEIGLIKPDPRVYAYAIECCRLDPERTIFIDDSPLNIAGARFAGLQAVRFTSPRELRSALAALGVL
jgi:2-haloacid dehalogenase